MEASREDEAAAGHLRSAVAEEAVAVAKPAAVEEVRRVSASSEAAPLRP